MSCDRATAAIRWFVGSGVQFPGGGVARYYRADLAQNAGISTEITGYAVSSLVYLHARRGDGEALAAATRAADFLVDAAWDPEVQTYPYEYKQSEPLAYFFDCGIIVRGLLAIYRATGDKRYLTGAVRGGHSMMRHFPSQNRIHPVVSLPSFTPLPYAEQWSRSPCCYQLKSAMAWRDLAEVTGDSRFAEAYSRALDSALETQRSFLPGATAEKTMDRLHAYSYFLEGLMPVAKRPEIGRVLEEGIALVAGYLREIRPVFERSDVYAQLLRVRLFAAQIAGVALDQSSASWEAESIPAFQIRDAADARRDGGYLFGRRAGAPIPHVNPVSTAFCSQAIEMWRDFQAGRQIELESLV
jgi:hypothetical protein